MMKLIIRILSFIICVGLLVGGAILTYTQTMKNDELFADFEEINNAEWIPAVNETVDETDDEIDDETEEEIDDENGTGEVE